MSDGRGATGRGDDAGKALRRRLEQGKVTGCQSSRDSAREQVGVCALPVQQLSTSMVSQRRRFGGALCASEICVFPVRTFSIEFFDFRTFQREGGGGLGDDVPMVVFAVSAVAAPGMTTHIEQ